MPYTLSHAAAALPLLRRGPLVGSALVVGTMSPDLLYFVFLETGVDARTHTWLGLVLIDLPVALAVLAVWQLFVVPALVALAPARLRARLVPREPVPRLSVAMVVSVLIGGATHLVWDAFTHHNGWVVEHYPSLRLWFWVGMPRYHFLQYASSVAGAALLVWWAVRWLRRREPVAVVPALYEPLRRPGRVICAVVATGIVLAAVRALPVMAWVADRPVLAYAHRLASGVAPSATQVQAGMNRVSICLVSGAFVALALIGVRQRLRARRAATGG
ncbi:DUF4184 family protein [Actinokineospora auranticolor]|uniref:Uncharacterized protein DUF4184 n=1 Tax=Actinokineospora auranticolor TaxID=155976 RepID=A0A2S6GV11_9PSEU|nr:DUF4184 family protein [Actinokineospora auranticolor]PPK68971.1 uncharacterized protein DUF4184 [Actinokineospora auranticolor]